MEELASQSSLGVFSSIVLDLVLLQVEQPLELYIYHLCIKSSHIFHLRISCLSPYCCFLNGLYLLSSQPSFSFLQVMAFPSLEIYAYYPWAYLFLSFTFWMNLNPYPFLNRQTFLPWLQMDFHAVSMIHFLIFLLIILLFLVSSLALELLFKDLQLSCLSPCIFHPYK